MIDLSGRGFWDLGIVWESRRTVAPTDLAATVEYIRDLVLRAVNGPLEDEHIRRLIQSATAVYEEWTQKALMPQTWQMVLDRFPPGRIRLERPPFIGITTFACVDETGAEQLLEPADYLVKPSGPYIKAEVWPRPGGAWPVTQSGRPDAVTITYQAGVADLDLAPELQKEIEGIALFVSECYTHRLFLVPGSHEASALKLEHFWKRVW